MQDSNSKSPSLKFTECEDCGCLWRVMGDGRIDFNPRGPFMHHPCLKCLKGVVKAAEAMGSPKPKRSTAKKSTKVEGE